MEFPSKKESDEATQFVLLPPDDYELIITEIKEEMQDKYMAKPDPNTGVKPQEATLRVVLEVVAFKDGAPASDQEGKDATGRKLFFTGRPGSMGWQQDGTPSKTRCLLAFATEQNIDEKLHLDDWQELIGKSVFAEVIQKANLKGKKTNRISRIITPRRDRTESKTIKDDEGHEIPVGEPPVEEEPIDKDEIPVIPE